MNRVFASRQMAFEMLPFLYFKKNSISQFVIEGWNKKLVCDDSHPLSRKFKIYNMINT